MAHFFTADPHFGHAAANKHERRPFVTVEEMNAALVSNFAAAMTPADDLWILGDFVRGAATDLASKILERIPGKKHLITGNHDRITIQKMAGWTSVAPYREMVLERQPLTLFHYPMSCWNGSHQSPAEGCGSIQIFGHLHGQTRGWWRCVNACVEVLDWRPASLSEIIARSEDNFFATPLHEEVFPARRRQVRCTTCGNIIDRGAADGGYRWEGDWIVTFRGHPVVELLCDWPEAGAVNMTATDGLFCAACLEVTLAYGDLSEGRHFRYAEGVTLDLVAGGRTHANRCS